MSEKTEQWSERIYTFAHETSGLNIETGKMGFCMYFFMLACSMKKELYQRRAEKLLDEIYEQLDRDISSTVFFQVFHLRHKPVTGIAWL